MVYLYKFNNKKIDSIIIFFIRSRKLHKQKTRLNETLYIWLYFRGNSYEIYLGNILSRCPKA